MKQVLHWEIFRDGAPIAPRILHIKHGELQLRKARLVTPNSVIGYYGRSSSLRRQSPAYESPKP